MGFPGRHRRPPGGIVNAHVPGIAQLFRAEVAICYRDETQRVPQPTCVSPAAAAGAGLPGPADSASQRRMGMGAGEAGGASPGGSGRASLGGSGGAASAARRRSGESSEGFGGAGQHAADHRRFPAGQPGVAGQPDGHHDRRRQRGTGHRVHAGGRQHPALRTAPWRRSCVLAETLGSLGAALHAGPGRVTVGLEISATHHRAAATARSPGWRPVTAGERSPPTSTVIQRRAGPAGRTRGRPARSGTGRRPAATTQPRPGAGLTGQRHCGRGGWRSSALRGKPHVTGRLSQTGQGATGGLRVARGDLADRGAESRGAEERRARWGKADMALKASRAHLSELQRRRSPFAGPGAESGAVSPAPARAGAPGNMVPFQHRSATVAWPAADPSTRPPDDRNVSWPGQPWSGLERPWHGPGVLRTEAVLQGVPTSLQALGHFLETATRDLDRGHQIGLGGRLDQVDATGPASRACSTSPAGERGSG